MKDNFFQSLRQALAEERMSAYCEDDAGEGITVARYLWNMALCESLYSPLQIAEIALRNTVHRNLNPHVCNGSWYADPENTKLNHWQQCKVTQGIKELQKQRKPVTEGRVVSELNFGFWTAFFDNRHATSGLGAHLAKTGFPHLQSKQRSLKNLNQRWREIRKLRNRVFHHERILHWTDLQQKHDRLIEAIGWISPELREMAEVLDRFSTIRREGLDPWLDKIQTHWSQS